MKSLKYIILSLLLIFTTGAQAQKVQVPHIYMFGFSASFTDPIVYFTEIQDMPNAWMDKKKKFLLGHDNYAEQMKNYLTEQQQPNRVCMVFFSTKKSKMEKEYLKLRKKYMGEDKKKKKKKSGGTTPELYDIRQLSAQDFKFEFIDMSE